MNSPQEKQKKIPRELKTFLLSKKKTIRDIDKTLRQSSTKIDRLQAKIEPLLEQLDAAQKAKLKITRDRQDILSGIQTLAVRLRGDLDPIELGEVLSTYLK